MNVCLRKRLCAVPTSLIVMFSVIACSGGGGNSDNVTQVSRPTNPAGPTAFMYQRSEELPTNQLAGKCMDADHGDIDGDGDLDLVLAQEFGENIVLLNDGNAKFVIKPDALNGGSGDNEDVLLRDFDGDSDLDIISVHEDDRVHAYFVNDGEGNFTDVSTLIPVVSTANAVEAVDINGDNSLDLLLGNDGANHALINAGDGTFSDQTTAIFSAFGVTQDLLLLDANGDNLSDVFIVNEGQNQLYLNTGNGSFREAEVGALPNFVDESREADAADIDGDGDMDIAVGNVQFNLNSPLQNRLLLNDGSGKFTDVTTERLPTSENNAASFTLRFFDVDRDGDVDILSANNRIGAGGDVDVWLNDGAGKFLSAAQSFFSSSPSGSTFDIEVFDANGDGVDDIYFCNRSGEDQLFVGVNSR